MTFDQELQAALDIEPSSQFVARVRARIAREPVQRGWNAWWFAPAVAFAAAIVVAAVFVSEPKSDRRELPRALLTSRALPSLVAPIIIQPLTTTVQRQPAAAPRAQESNIGTVLVLLDPRETAALRHLIAGAGPSRIAPAPWLRPSPFSVEEPVSPASLEIPDLVIEPLPTGSEGARQ